ncbi:MAG: glycosyltransferase family 4 protein, partial [Planctomycetota bacterium]|nr:glycosyltransferase family 4 protein [Planctomycetota bacterium]
GVDLERFTPANRAAGSRVREKFGVRSDETVLLFAGSGFERKGLRFALEAAALCAPNMPLKFFIVGHGDRAKHRKLVHRLHLDGRVMFLGRRENIEEFYAAADVFILPTLYEPFGSVVLEAMASGLPCIVSSTSGAAEILSHGVDSLVAQDPTSSPELAHLVELLRDAETRARIGTAARQTAMNYSLDANVSRTLDLYRRVCEIKSRS